VPSIRPSLTGEGEEARVERGTSFSFPTPVRLLRWAALASLPSAALVILSASSSNIELFWFQFSFYGSTLHLPFPSPFQFAAVLVSTLAAAIAFGWTTYRDEVRRTLSNSRPDDVAIIWVLLSSLATVGLVELLHTHVEVSLPYDNLAFTLGVAALSLVAFIGWCLAAMPARFWWNCASRQPLTLIGATTVGLLVYAIDRHYLLFGLLVPLERVTVEASSALLHLVTRNVFVNREDGVLGVNGFMVRIEEPCSGVEGIGLFGVFFGIYLWIFRKELRFPQTLALIPIGFLALFCLNIIRIVALVLLGAWSGSLAIAGFHSVAGWLLFNAVTLTALVATKRSSFFSKTLLQIRDTSVENPAAPYLIPLVTVLVVAMVTRIFSFKFDALYPLRAAILAAVLWFYGKRLPLRWTISWSAVFLGCVAFVVWILLAGPAGTPGRDIVVATALKGLFSLSAGLWITGRVAGAVILVPIAEELAFRGYLLRKLVAADFENVAFRHFSWLSFLGSSALFGLLHTEWFAGILAGMIFALAMYRRGSLTDAVVAHGTTNGLLAAYVLMTGHWSLWD